MRNEELYNMLERNDLFNIFNLVEKQEYEPYTNSCIECGRLVPFDEGFCNVCIELSIQEEDMGYHNSKNI